MEFVKTLNLKTKLVISDKEYDFELYTIHRGIFQEIKLDNHIYTIDGEKKEDIPIDPPVELRPTPAKIPGKKRGPYKHWTKKDIQYLEDNHGKIPAKDIADHLGIENMNLIYYKVHHLELRKNIHLVKDQPEDTTTTIKKPPRQDDLEEFLSWLHKWENHTFTRGDIRRCTTLTGKRVDIMLEDQLIKGTIKTVSDFEYAKVKLLDNGKLIVNGTSQESIL